LPLSQGICGDLTDFAHSTGTSKIFYNDPSVLYVSLHGSPDYPCTLSITLFLLDQPFIACKVDYTGSASERGGPLAPNLNLNYPLPLGTDDETYLSTLRKAVGEVAKFEPEMLFVS